MSLRKQTSFCLFFFLRRFNTALIKETQHGFSTLSFVCSPREEEEKEEDLAGRESERVTEEEEKKR